MLVARDIMTPNPVTARPDDPLGVAVEVVRLMRDHKFGGVPVVEEGRLVGIITETDLMGLLIRLLEHGIDETRWVQMRRHGNRQAPSVHAHERS